MVSVTVERLPQDTHTAIQGKGFFAVPYRTVHFSIFYLFWMYSMLVILPGLNCTQFDTRILYPPPGYPLAKINPWS
jgi:hypothetical protein